MRPDPRQFINWPLSYSYWRCAGIQRIRDYAIREVTIAEVFVSYQTGLFGKWHNGEHYPNNPPGQGFDEYFGFCAGHIVNFRRNTGSWQKHLSKCVFYTEINDQQSKKWAIHKNK